MCRMFAGRAPCVEVGKSIEMPWDGRIPASSSIEAPFRRIGGGIVRLILHEF